MDDILIHAADQAEHDKRVQAVLGRIQEAGLTLNTIKCQFSRSSLTFLGHIIDGSGIQADPQKTTAEARSPHNAMRSKHRVEWANATYLGFWLGLELG